MEIRRYVTESGHDLVHDWLEKVHDIRAKARIAARITRLAAGNFGDCKPLRDGVWEQRIDYGPGYRIYYAKVGRSCVVLLGGGDKRRQSADIDRAIACWKDYQRRQRR